MEDNLRDTDKSNETEAYRKFLINEEFKRFRLRHHSKSVTGD
ncbi:MAG: hypothetical protein VZS44_07845 [Bacilli bacterium]|nr:hypothetical protein [Bacilli bacterium]